MMHPSLDTKKPRLRLVSKDPVQKTHLTPYRYNIRWSALILGWLAWGWAHPGQGKTFTILHTNDWQSRLLHYPALSTNPGDKTGDKTVGGVARLATLIEQTRQIASLQGPVLLVDSGDFTMGTLFHTVAREKGYELQLLQMLGYDAVSLGNHEFDFRVQGLVQMIHAAKSKVGKLPPILASNIVFDDQDSRDDGLAALMQDGTLKPFSVIEKQGIRFGLLGILGQDAMEVAPEARPVTFRPALEAAQEVIDLLRKQYKADIIIMLSHSGVLPKKGQMEGQIDQMESQQWGGEEVTFATELKGLDIIVGGHSHTPLHKPIMVGKVPILQAGSDMRFMGELTMDYEAGELRVHSYTLHPIDDSITPTPHIQALLVDAKNTINETILKPYALEFDTPVAHISQPYTRGYAEHHLGTLVSEALRHSAQADIGFMANGALRDDLRPGKTGVQTVGDLFHILPLGIGLLDDHVGYPLIKLYLTGAELKHVLEILLFTYKLKGDSYFPRFAGMRFFYNPYRVPLDQVYRIELQQPSGSYQSIDLNSPDSLYSVGTTSYIGSFLWLIEKMSYGLYKVHPKHADGRLITHMTDAIVDHDPSQEGVQEYKAWAAFLDFIKTLPRTEQWPSLDGQASNPMIATPSLNPRILFAHATWLQWSMLWLLLGFLGGGAWLCRKLWRRCTSSKKCHPCLL